MDVSYKEVNFHEYCPKCKHDKDAEVKDPCNLCLHVIYRLGTEVPDNFEPKEEK